jgi:hypothetical protein
MTGFRKDKRNMLADLPVDVLILVCARLSAREVDSVLGACADLRARATDSFYRSVAVEQWGTAFWARALTRRTLRTFVSMREELRGIYRFEQGLRAMGVDPWTAREYYAFWRFEESCG